MNIVINIYLYHLAFKNCKKVTCEKYDTSENVQIHCFDCCSSTFEVHFHGTNADRHGSTKDRSVRLHKQIKTPKLISNRKKLESREKRNN